MTTLGRIVAAIGIAAVLAAGILLGTHYLGKSDKPPAVPKPPVTVETPSTPVAGPASPEPGEMPGVSTPGATAGVIPVGPSTPEATKVAPGRVSPGAGLPPVSAGPGDAAAADGLAMMRDRPVQAQKRLSEALRAGVGGAKASEVREALRSLADKVQFSNQRLPDDPYEKAYQVVSGDSLIAIGKKHSVPFELIMRVNRMGAPSVTAGQQIKVIQGPIHIEILKGRRELQAWLGDVCLRAWGIGIGTSNKTPEGTFVVKSKMKNPPYQPQHKTRADFKAAGAPDNPLGARWIDIGNHYGIHGTIDPTSIGREVSEGCIRLLNKDVEELYDMVVPGGSKVTIKP
jgi:LysM repeat protein